MEKLTQLEHWAMAELHLTSCATRLFLEDDKSLVRLAVLLGGDAVSAERCRSICRALARVADRIQGGGGHRYMCASVIPQLLSRLGFSNLDNAWQNIAARVVAAKQLERAEAEEEVARQIVVIDCERSRSPATRLQRLLRRAAPVPPAQAPAPLAAPDDPEPEPGPPLHQQQQLAELAAAAEQQHVVVRLETAEKRIEDLMGKLKTAQNKANYWKSKAADLQEQLVELKQTGGSAHPAMEIKHEKNRWLDSASRFAVCVRRNMSNASMGSFGAVVLSDLSRATVSRAETGGAEALQRYYFAWHAKQEQALHRTLSSKGYGHYEIALEPLCDDEEPDAEPVEEPAPSPAAAFVPPTACLEDFQLAFHIFAGDATNSRVWKGSKVHSMCLTSAYLQESKLVVDQRDLRGVLCKESFLADIQIVEDGTASGTHGMLLKQFASCGCKTWLRKVGSRVEAKHVIDMFCYTSDRGSEQAKVRKLASSEVLVTSQDPTCLWADWDCTMHATQLIVKTGLAILDAGLRKCGKNYTYFSSIAKFVNVWRENFKGFWKRWVKADLASAMEHRALPARCIAGRWGSIYASESRLDAGAHVLQQITGDALSKRIADAEQVDREGEGQADDLRVELQAEYRRRQGTWSRDASRLSTDDVFWSMVKIAKASHETTEAMMQKANKFSLHRNKEKAATLIANEGGFIFKLVTGLADDFAKKFSDMLSIDRPWNGMLPIGRPGDIDALNQTIVLLNLHHAAGFERRIHMHCRRCYRNTCAFCGIPGLGPWALGQAKLKQMKFNPGSNI